MEPKEAVRTRKATRAAVMITPVVVSRLLWTCIALLLAANLSVIYFKFVLDHHYLRGMVEAFFFDNEANFPSMYSALAILLSSILLWKISQLPTENSGNRRSWRFLSALFLFLAADELISLHEYLIGPMRGVLAGPSLESGFLYFAWFLPYTIAMLICGIFLLRFFLRLPPSTRRGFVLACTIFVSGAVGLEMIGGNYWQSQGWSIDEVPDIDMTYAFIVTIEELLEMAGIVVFVQILCQYYLERRSHSFLLDIIPSGK